MIAWLYRLYEKLVKADARTPQRPIDKAADAAVEKTLGPLVK